jgi:glycosyltransferase involved in cell wall biosynthesis
LKIGIYLEEYQVGGVDFHLISLLESWPNKDDSFVLFTNHDNKGLSSHLEKFKKLNLDVQVFTSFAYITYIQKIMTLPAGSKLRYFLFPFLPFFLLMQFLQARFLLKKNKLDFLIADNGAYPGAWGSLASSLAAQQIGLAHFLLIHHTATPYQLGRKFFERWLDRKISLGTQCVAVSEATKKSVYKLRTSFSENSRIEVIYNGTNLVCDKQEILLLKKFRDKQEGKKLIGLLGRVEKYKGHEDLIIGASELSITDLNKVELVFIGSFTAAEKERLESLAKEKNILNKVHFLGFVDGDSKNIIKYLDLLMVLTKDFEGFGLTLIEAMAVGVPVLATKVGAIEEFIIHRRNGFLINPCSPDEVKVALEEFINNDIQWKKQAELALQEISNFSSEHMSNNYYNFLRKVKNEKNIN